MMLPAFKMVKTAMNERAIKIAVMSLLCNSMKRVGGQEWNDDDKLKKWNLIRGESTYDDMRLNLLIVGEAGSGKTSLMSGMERLSPYDAVFRKSMPNYDQMIGSTEKWREGGEWFYEPFPGELSCDLFLMDEVLSIYLEDKLENKRVRELLRSALSRIGTNRVTKPQVRVPPESQVNYYPECTLVQGFPPRKVPLHILTDGDLRRAHIVTIEFPLEEKKKTKRFGQDLPPTEKEEKADDEKVKKAKEYLTWLRSHRYTYWVPPDTEAYIRRCLAELEEFTKPMGWKAMHFYSTSFYDLESRLLRFSIAMAVIRDAEAPTVRVEVEDVKEAMSIFAPSYADSLVWVNSFTTGIQSDVTGIGDADQERAERLARWLAFKDAFEYASTTVSAIEVKQWMISQGWFSTENGTKRFYQTVLATGIIRSRKRGGQYVVWLGEKGKNTARSREKEEKE
jgi:hypothetical protein